MNKVSGFLSEVSAELKKASWPWDPKEKGTRKYKELIDSTIVVIIAMLLLSGFTTFFDFILGMIVTTITTGSLR